jgi:serine/threonine-protein kinase PRP4
MSFRAYSRNRGGDRGYRYDDRRRDRDSGPRDDTRRQPDRRDFRDDRRQDDRRYERKRSRTPDKRDRSRSRDGNRDRDRDRRRDERPNDNQRSAVDRTEAIKATQSPAADDISRRNETRVDEVPQTAPDSDAIDVSDVDSDAEAKRAEAEAKAKEERRKRLQAIVEKHKPAPGPASSLEATTQSQPTLESKVEELLPALPEDSAAAMSIDDIKHDKEVKVDAVVAPTDGFDMFSDDAILDHMKKGRRAFSAFAASLSASGAPAPDDGDDLALADNWTDAEGYFKVNVGEVLEGRYRVLGTAGRGVFSCVLICEDTASDGRRVAIKVLKNNDTMRRAGVKELEIHQLVKTGDTTGRGHVVQLTRHFDHRGHLCLVFELMHMNLKDVLDKFGKGVGIKISAVRVYAKQLLVALYQLARFRVVHADIKPHNILVNEGFTQVKVWCLSSLKRTYDSL